MEQTVSLSLSHAMPCHATPSIRPTPNCPPPPTDNAVVNGVWVDNACKQKQIASNSITQSRTDSSAEIERVLEN